MALPLNLTLPQMQQQWKQQLDPLTAAPFASGRILKSVSLAAGANVLNHGLGQTLQGWIVTRMYGVFSQIFDTQATNAMPQLTLQLDASVPVVVDLFVF